MKKKMLEEELRKQKDLCDIYRKFGRECKLRSKELEEQLNKIKKTNKAMVLIIYCAAIIINGIGLMGAIWRDDWVIGFLHLILILIVVGFTKW